MKECFKCKEIKPYGEFYKHKKMADGHLNKCKECTKKDSINHRYENIEKVRAYDRNRPNKVDRAIKTGEYCKTKKGKEIRFVAAKNYREKNPLRYKANSAVSNALRDGRLHRPDTCSQCGVNCKPQGHHDDYSQPLVVRWLCVDCHNKFHLFMRELYRNLAHTGIENRYLD